MLRQIKSPVEVKSMIDAVKLVEIVRKAEIKLYGLQLTDDETLRVRIERDLQRFCQLPVKKSEQLTLDI